MPAVSQDTNGMFIEPNAFQSLNIVSQDMFGIPIKIAAFPDVQRNIKYGMAKNVSASLATLKFLPMSASQLETPAIEMVNKMRDL